LIDVLASSVNIMQYKITKNRLKQDTPDFILSPKTGHLGLMEFNRASEAIKEGVFCVKEHELILKKIVKKK
jgi:NTE family protein